MPWGHIPFTAPAKKALEGSLRESLHLGHDHIGTEHLLLGLLATDDAGALEVLGNLHVAPASLRETVLAQIGEPEAPGHPTPAEMVDMTSEHTVFVVPSQSTTAERLAEVVRAVREITENAPTVLHRQPSGPHANRAIIERFEENGPEPGAAVVILSGGDVAGAQPSGPSDAPALRTRADQDTIYELGWFHGQLGRHRVIVLVEEGVDTPGDIGVPYVALDTGAAWRTRLATLLKTATTNLDIVGYVKVAETAIREPPRARSWWQRFGGRQSGPTAD